MKRGLLAENNCLLAERRDVGGDARLVVGNAAKEGHGALASQQVMVNHATDTYHCKTAVLDLLELHRGKVLLAHTQGIEHVVTRGAAAALHGIVDSGKRQELEEANPK